MRTFQVTIEESVYEKLEQISARARRPAQWQAEVILINAIMDIPLPEVSPGDIPPIRQSIPQPARAERGGRDGQA